MKTKKLEITTCLNFKPFVRHHICTPDKRFYNLTGHSGKSALFDDLLDADQCVLSISEPINNNVDLEIIFLGVKQNLEKNPLAIKLCFEGTLVKSVIGNKTKIYFLGDKTLICLNDESVNFCILNQTYLTSANIEQLNIDQMIKEKIGSVKIFKSVKSKYTISELLSKVEDKEAKNQQKIINL